MDEIPATKLNRLRNLPYYKGKTDDEIREMIKQKSATITPITGDRSYDKLFNEKLAMLQNEHRLDMNDSNDREMIINLAKHMVQSDKADRDIRILQDRPDKTKDDVGTLKALGDFQRDVQITIADLQDKLGISRKVRKEKSVDDIPKFIDNILEKGIKFWEEKTSKVMCSRCNIELVRNWVNFPEATTIKIEADCPQCKEKVTWNG